MKELTIIPPEGYEIDKEKSIFEKIVFKKKDTKPRSWKEYRAKVPENKLYRVWGVVEGEELAKALPAIMQLMSVREDWIDDWKPDWTIISQPKYVIQFKNNKLSINEWRNMSHPLSFPTQEMAEEFLNCFKDLIEQAKLLI